MRMISREEAEALAGRLDGAWRDSSIPAQQLALAKREIEAWRAGEPHGPFDAMRRLLAGMDGRMEVLEVGCGAGYYAPVLEDLGFLRLVLTDYSEAMVAAAREAWGEEEPTIVGDKLRGRERTFEVADARELPYGDQSFDLVIHGCVMLHLAGAPDREKSLKEAARVARRWVLVHRTPMTREPESTHWLKEAYGVECVEVHFSEREYEGLLAGARLSVMKREEWPGGESVCRSDLCEVAR